MPAKVAEIETPKPTVSVAEAMGLPKDWSFSDSLAGTDKAKREKQETPEETISDDDQEETGVESGEGAAGEKPKVEEKPVGEKSKAGEKPAEEKPKTGEKPTGEKTKTGEKLKVGEKSKAAEKPKVGEKPVEEKPAVEKPAAPAKIKVGGKEYTPEELEAKLAAAPVVEKKELTEAEKETQKKEIERKDNDWIETTAKALPAPVDEATLDVILAGGKDAVETMQKIRQTDMARSILLARKSMFNDLQPIIDDLRARQEPLVNQSMQEADEREWNTFSTAYGELSNYRKAVETVANALVEKDGERVSKLTMPQFQAEVAKTAKRMLKEDFGIDADELYKLKMASAEEAEKNAAAAAAGVETSGEKPAEKTGEKPAGEKAAPVRAKVAPPAGNLPSPTPAKGTKGGNGDSEIIKSLW